MVSGDDDVTGECRRSGILFRWFMAWQGQFMAQLITIIIISIIIIKIPGQDVFGHCLGNEIRSVLNVRLTTLRINYRHLGLVLGLLYLLY